MTTIEDANFALQKVLDAGSKKNVIELAWIKNVRVTIPRVIVTLSLPSFANSQRNRIFFHQQLFHGLINGRSLPFFPFHWRSRGKWKTGRGE